MKTFIIVTAYSKVQKGFVNR